MSAELKAKAEYVARNIGTLANRPGYIYAQEVAQAYLSQQEAVQALETQVHNLRGDIEAADLAIQVAHESIKYLADQNRCAFDRDMAFRQWCGIMETITPQLKAVLSKYKQLTQGGA